MSYMQRLLFAMEQEEEDKKNMLRLEAQREEIDQIDLTAYAEPLLNLISQLSASQQAKLRAIIYQTKQLDAKLISFQKFTKPYELDVVNAYESANGMALPLELKVYLTCVSSSVYKTHLDCTKITLGRLINMPTIVEGVGYYQQTELEDIDDDVYDVNQTEYNMILEKLRQAKDTTVVLELRGCGCGYTDQIVLNSGNNFGQVWHEKFAGDGVFSKVNESFFDYALKITSN